MGKHWSQARSWTRYRKLTDEEILAVKFMGENRQDAELAIALFESLGVAEKAENIWAERITSWLRAPGGSRIAPALISAETLAGVFGVGPRIINYIWSGRYWTEIRT